MESLNSFTILLMLSQSITEHFVLCLLIQLKNLTAHLKKENSYLRITKRFVSYFR